MSVSWLNLPGWWIFVLLVPFVIILVYYCSRSGVKKLTAVEKSLLVGLRSILVLFAILIFFQPVIEEESETGLPKVVNVFVSNSWTMANFADEFRKKQQELAVEAGGRIDFQFFTVSESIEYIADIEKIDGLKSKGTTTWEAVQDVAEMIGISDAQTAVIVTDDPSMYLKALNEFWIRGRGSGVADRRSKSESDGRVYFVTPEAGSFTNSGIMQVDYHRYIRLGDHLPIRAYIYSTGSVVGDSRVEIYESGRLIAGKDIKQTGGELISAAFDYRPLSAGRKDFKVRLISDRDDVDVDNEYSFKVDVIADSIRVLYLEGYPRWEYQHLRKLFEKDDSLLLIDYLVQDDPYGILSTINPDRWDVVTPGFGEYDVIMLGDVNPEGRFLSSVNKEKVWKGLAEYVEEGGGLIFIPGKRSSEKLFKEKTVSRLLPVEFQPGTYGENVSPQYMPLITPSGKLSRLFRGRIYEDISILVNRNETEKAFPIVPWVYTGAVAKKSSMTLMEARGVESDGGDRHDSVLINYHNYGKGLVMYVGTDMLWKFKIISDGTAYKNLWSNILRFVASSAIDSGGSNVILKTDKSVYQPGDTVHLFLVSEGEKMPDELTVSLHEKEDKTVLNILKLGGNSYYSSFVAREPGEYRIAMGDVVQAVRVDNKGIREVMERSIGRKYGKDPELPDGIERIGLSEYKELIKRLSIVQNITKTTITRIDLWNNWYVFTALVFTYMVELMLRRKFNLI